MKVKLGVEGNSVQRASLPCVGAQRGGQARCRREISVEGKFAVIESSAWRESCDQGGVWHGGEMGPGAQRQGEPTVATGDSAVGETGGLVACEMRF